MGTVAIIEGAIKLLGVMRELATANPDDDIDALLDKLRSAARRTPKLTREGFADEDSRIDEEIREGLDP